MLWNASTGDLIRTFDHGWYISSVTFSPDGTQILTGSWDGDVKLWNVATRERIRTLSGHASGVNSVAFSPDGTKILSGSYDKTAKMWDAAKGTLLRTFSGHTDRSYA